MLVPPLTWVVQVVLKRLRELSEYAHEVVDLGRVVECVGLANGVSEAGHGSSSIFSDGLGAATLPTGLREPIMKRPLVRWVPVGRSTRRTLAGMVNMRGGPGVVAGRCPSRGNVSR